jgi:ribosomal protein S27AE
LITSIDLINSAENICPRCNKRVFHAEHRIAEGLMWHQQCWAKEFKEREIAKKSRKDTVS